MHQMPHNDSNSGGGIMGILDNLEEYIQYEEPYKVACSICNKLFIKSTDEPFTCLLCSK
jgi:hypothetical protein